MEKLVSPPPVKIVLTHLGSRDLFEGENLSTEEIDISDSFDINDTVEIVQTRDGLNGIIRELSFPQTYYKKAFQKLKETYLKYGHKAYGRVKIYERDKVSYTTYHLIETLEIDFNTIEIEDNQLTIQLTEYSISDVIQSNAKTKYDINNVDFLHIGGTPLIRYPHIALEVQRGLNFVFNNTVSQSTAYDRYKAPFININDDKNGIVQNDILFRNMETAAYADEDWFKENDSYFIKNISESNKRINLTINLDLTTESETPILLTNTYLYLIDRVLTFDSSGNEVYTNNVIYQVLLPINGTVNFSYNNNFNLIAGHELTLVFRTQQSFGYPLLGMNVTTVQNKFELSFTTKHQGRNNDKTTNIRSYTPDAVLQVLINKMTTSTKYTGTINWMLGDKNKFVLVAAETLRNFSPFTLHTSFDDFRKWMHTLGYVIRYIDEKSLEFVPYTSLFNRQTSNINQIDKKYCNNLQVTADTTYVYTDVEIGYNLPRYDNENGRYEIMGTFSYSTGVILPQVNKLSLISPYRADSVGFELLTWETAEEGKDTTDNKADNDVFVVFGTNGEFGFEIDFSHPVKIGDTGVELFNWYLMPTYLALRHGSLFRISTERLKFTATNAYRQATFNDADIYIDIPTILYHKLFEPINLKIECLYNKNMYHTDKRYGLIEFEYKGRTLKGFIKEASRIVGNREISELVLYPINYLNS